MKCFPYICPLHLCHPAFGHGICSNEGGRGVEIFFHFSTCLIRAAFRACGSVEMCHLTELEGLPRRGRFAEAWRHMYS